MSRPLIPRPLSRDSEMNTPQTMQKPKKISTACGACKQRKTKCSGSNPCEACATRGSPCVYDASSDQRRKIAAQRTMHELTEVNQNLERHKQLLGGILAIVRTNSDEAAVKDLLSTIRSGVDLPQLAAHVRNARRANPMVERSFADISFIIDGADELPSPTQLLTESILPGSASRGSVSSGSGVADAQPYPPYPGHGVNNSTMHD